MVKEVIPGGCQSLCKDTNFKANHNVMEKKELNKAGVNLFAKIRILKQITTRCANKLKNKKVSISMQRYEF